MSMNIYLCIYIYITYFTVFRDCFYVIKGLPIEIVLSNEPNFHENFHENATETNQSYKPACLSHQSGKLSAGFEHSFFWKIPHL